MKRFLIIFLISCISSYQINAKKDFSVEEKETPVSEDLMKEHGLLNRALLIYEKIDSILDGYPNDLAMPLENVLAILHETAMIIDHFIHQYHEKLEENYIFPILKKHNKDLDIIAVLEKQHIKGGKVTRKLACLAANNLINSSNIQTIKNLMQEFITMYRPHEAREDTIIFPQVRELLDPQDFEKLSDIFEDTEHGLFGEHGFTSILHKIEVLEKQLGIYDLNQFTPQVE